MTTSKWMKFFTDAGLPSHVAANYSIIFTENRMQVDMLMDLNKEYLYDMGIRLMGDVIAILKHARTAYTEAAQEKILNMSEVKPNTDYPSLTTGNAVDHYLQRARCSSSVPQPEFFSEVSKKKKMISLKRKSDDDAIQARKLRMVNRDKVELFFPEIEKSQTSSSAPTKSVFNRLGESSVSSSTDVIKRKGPSIFARLGPSKVKRTPDLVTVGNDEHDSEDVEDRNEMRMLSQSVTSNLKLRESRDLRSRLGSKPISATAVSTTSADPVRLIRKSLQDSQMQRLLINPTSMASRNYRAQQRQVLQRTTVNLRPSSSSLSISSGRVSSRMAPAHRIVKKPMNQKTSIFDRLGPAFSS